MSTIRLPFLVQSSIVLLLVSTSVLLPAQKERNQQPSATTGQARQDEEAETKAIAGSDKLEMNTVAIFDEHGNLKTEAKVDPTKWSSLKEYASRICDGPVPISPKCVRCKSGEILCANVRKKQK